MDSVRKATQGLHGVAGLCPEYITSEVCKAGRPRKDAHAVSMWTVPTSASIRKEGIKEISQEEHACCLAVRGCSSPWQLHLYLHWTA